MPTPKTKEVKNVFISHSSKDKEIADAFVDIILHGAMSIDLDEIFCISTEGTKIKSGDNWRDSIKSSLISSKVTFLIITPNYKESEVCLNEMGAAWVLSSLVLPTIVEPITFKTVGVIPEVTQVEKLLDEGSLDRLKDAVQAALAIPSSKIASDRWSTKKKEFIRRVQKHIASVPFVLPIERTKFDSLVEENKVLNNSLDDMFDEKQKLEQEIKELEKTKNASEVKKIKEKFHPSSLWDRFEQLCNNITKQLTTHKAIIRGIIFNTYTNKNITINWQSYEAIIDDARADDIIDEDMEADWRTTNKMEKLYEALQKLDKFLTGTLDDSFYEKYQNEYEAPLKMDNKSFWEEAFGLTLVF